MPEHLRRIKLKCLEKEPQYNEECFVFGSNESGIHGAGAARFAYTKKGARFGFSYGHWGESFAIPTKDKTITEALSLEQIRMYVDGFIAYAIGHPEIKFQVSRIGCGLAGLRDEDVAPLFKFAPSNCFFDTVWKPLLGSERNYWGTF